jgi:hypothetical protein
MRNAKKLFSSAMMSVVVMTMIALFSVSGYAEYGSKDVYTLENFDQVAGATYWTNWDKNNPSPYNVVSGVDGLTGKGIEGTRDFYNHFSTTFDIAKYTDGNYAFKIRVHYDSFNWPNKGEDNDWGFEITSLSGSDRSSYRWGKGDYLPQSGWNVIYLPITNKNKVKGLGTLNPAKMNFLRLYNTYSGTNKAILDSITIVDYKPDLPKQEGNILTIDNCDDSANFISGALSRNNKEGSGAVFGGAWNPDQDASIIRRWITPFDSKLTKDEGAIKFWLYISDPAQVKDYQFEITSSGQADSSEISWTPEQFTLKAGWHEYELTMKTGLNNPGTTEKDFVASKMDYLRFYAIAINPILIGMDDIRIIQPIIANSTSSSGIAASSGSISSGSNSSGITESGEMSVVSSESLIPESEADVSSESHQDQSDVESASSKESGNSGPEEPQGKNDSTVVMLVVLGAVVLLGGAASIYFFVIRKP